jgi:hypothetical protein
VAYATLDIDIVNHATQDIVDDNAPTVSRAEHDPIIFFD